ncbi:hypothetical protein RJ639_021253 [Escallonia herrerae]|uniref:Bifunctional inhibitor/plant lipid transfer protein/seed storage helical domain-containing protein n=1 Tax=Escallonia herrerae TaxID=1293975 RepID=A0AA88V3U8_9ASTE|nr:hypothetical protein RJ639_021253 [Escallonia herrerae]
MKTPTSLITGALLLAALLVAALPATEAQSPSPAPGPGMDCMTALLNLSDCLSYVEEGSNLTKPDKACCPELAGLVESQPICLCQLLSKSGLGNLGIQIDLNKALKLPSVCGVATPPVETCAEVVLGPFQVFQKAGDLRLIIPVCIIPLSDEEAIFKQGLCLLSDTAVGVPVGVPTSSEAPASNGGVPPSSLAASPTAGDNGNGASSIAVPSISFFIGLATVAALF